MCNPLIETCNCRAACAPAHVSTLEACTAAVAHHNELRRQVQGGLPVNAASLSERDSGLELASGAQPAHTVAGPLMVFCTSL